ncbi:hypothetical protein KKG71_04845 [Patescibacteria group bacterium]|nr:hypothetical protein [Patescibacteria group bacterium]
MKPEVRVAKSIDLMVTMYCHSSPWLRAPRATRYDNPAPRAMPKIPPIKEDWYFVMLWLLPLEGM